MPNGKTHTLSTIIASAAILPLAAMYSHDPLFTMAVISGTLSGIIISPDLDVEDGFYGLHVLRRCPKVGKLISMAWRVFWYPYSRLVPHRSRFSHSIGLGTLGRIAYLFGFIFLFCVLTGTGLDVSSQYLFAWSLGLGLADALHITMDHFSGIGRKSLYH